MSQSERLLWELPRVDDDAERALPSDESLRDYRAGALDDRESERIEWELTRSRAARARLFELADEGMTDDEALGRVRRRLFAPPKTRRRVWVLAASIAGLLAIGLWLWALSVDRTAAPTLFAAVEFEVRLEGSAIVRSTPEGEAGSVEARADTRLRIAVETIGPAQETVAWGVYRVAGSALERIDDAPGVQAEYGRGAVAFDAIVADWIGSEAGDYRILVVAAPTERLESHLAFEAGEDPVARLESATGGRVVERRLRIVKGGG